MVTGQGVQRGAEHVGVVAGVGHRQRNRMGADLGLAQHPGPATAEGHRHGGGQWEQRSLMSYLCPEGELNPNYMITIANDLLLS